MCKAKSSYQKVSDEIVCFIVCYSPSFAMASCRRTAFLLCDLLNSISLLGVSSLHCDEETVHLKELQTFS